ncbi:hypothetical protein [Lacinutrix sp. Bg11-31]|uniref:hypothetical protein n=1 Tax=Lacinutrix sp. Bg11-31 TaxID=2057808 RepID=UPI000C30091E|nr:hypothetical protein [Lacinutrix sp. Bg11-31]AUC81240.1 hypothetical protein CW733_03455 [Lacinutrix sp. Bg11-31]
MLEFLFYYNSIITHSIEAIAAITGLFCLKKYKGTAAIFFIWLLVYLCLVDVLGMYPKYYNTFDFLEPIKNSIFRRNSWWFTIFFDIIAVILFSLLFQKILKKKLSKNILKYGIILYSFIAIILIVLDIDALFKSNFRSIYILETILICCCSVFYFIEVLNSDNFLQFSKSLYFYISIAIFIWWLVVTPLVFFDQYFVLEDESFVLLKKSIYILSNIFMYLTFTIGLIVSKPEKTE